MDPLNYNENIVSTTYLYKQMQFKSYEEVMDIIKEYEDIIKTKKKNIIIFAYQRGKVFRKFKENRKFKSLAEQLKITMGIIIL